MKRKTDRKVLEKVREKTHNNVDKMINRAENMQDTSVAGINQMKKQEIEMVETDENYIKNNPKKSVLIAAGVGVVVGAIIAKSMKGKKD